MNSQMQTINQNERKKELKRQEDIYLFKMGILILIILIWKLIGNY